MDKIMPIFIGGCPRSGTTMLASLLGNNEVLVTPESQFKIEIIQKLSSKNNSSLSDILDDLNCSYRFDIWNLEISYVHLLDYYGVNQINAQELIRYLLDEYNEKNSNKKFRFWVDHTPENIMHAKKLIKVFPNAKFIHIIRDGRAVANSIKNLDWGGYSTYYTSRYWASNISYGLALERILSADNFLAVSYEEIVVNPEKILKEICMFTGIEYSQNMINGNGFVVPEYTKKQHSLVGGKPIRERIDSWKWDLSELEIRIFENRTHDLLEYLGYELEFDTSEFGLSKGQRMVIDFREIFERLHNRYKRKKRIKKVMMNGE